MLDKNKWHFIVGIVDAKARKIEAYVDGKLIQSASIPTGDIPGTPAKIWVGGTPENYQWAQAVYDELAIFNAALSEDDMEDIMSGLAKALKITPVSANGKPAATWGR